MAALYPRVLILNQQSLAKDNATGITLRSLWQNWPSENRLEIYLDAFEKQVADPKNGPSYVLPPTFLSKMAHHKTAQRINANMKGQAPTAFSAFKTQLRQLGVWMLDLLPVSLPARLVREIDAFSPEVIYTLGATVGSLRLASKLSCKYHIPVVIHYMDNWVESLQWENNFFVKPYRYFLNRSLKRCLQAGSLGLAISPQMAEAYSQKLNMPFSSIMNCVDVDRFYQAPRPFGDSLRFVYAGGLHLQRDKALSQIAKALQDLLPQAQLHIYTASAFSKEQFPNNTHFHLPVSHDDIQMVYQDADVLIHAETDNPLLLGFFKYSISTKVPEYLASGRAFLFYGPKTLGVYDYLRKHGAAYLAHDQVSLRDCLRTIASQQKQSEILSNALELARQKHDVSMNQTILLNSLQQAISDYQKMHAGRGKKK